MKVLGIGESVIDNVYLIDKQSDENLHALPQKHIGGPILIATILLSRLGVGTTLLTTIGRDENGSIIKRTLQNEGVHLLSKVQKKTKANTILVQSQTGERRKIHEVLVHRTISNLDRKFVQQFDVILIDRHQPQAFYEVLMKKKATTRILIDPSTEASELTYDMIRYSDYPIIPIELVVAMGKERDLQTCLKKIFLLAEKTVIVTAGNLGTLTYDGKDVLAYPAISVRTVDTTGAGDIYRGAFAYGLTKNWSIARCIQFANKIAALQCTRIGNAAAIPSKSEIDLCNHLFLTEKTITMPTINTYFTHLYQAL